jgi:predicted MFS family arabinose efflux permease
VEVLDTKMERLLTKWTVLMVVILAFSSYGFAIAVISPVLGPLAKTFQIGISTAAYISTFTFIGAAIMALPAGLIVDRWGIKRAGILAQGLLAIGWLVTYISPTFTSLLLGRVIIGIGGTTMGVMGGSAVVQWFKPKELLLAMGLWAAGLPLSISWGEVLAGEIVSTSNFRYAFLVGVIIAVASLITIYISIKPGPYEPSRGPKKPREISNGHERGATIWKDFLNNGDYWKFNFALFLGIIPFIGVTTFWVTWLTLSKAITSVVIASSIASLIGIMGIFGAAAAGYIGAKIGKNKPVFVVPSAIFGLAILGFIWASGMLLIVFISLLIGLISYMLSTMMFAIPPQLVPHRLTGTALGITNGAFFNLAGIFGPILIGGVYARSGSLLLPGMIMFFCLVAASLLAQSMKFK